jgi:hypothetical protein
MNNIIKFFIAILLILIWYFWPVILVKITPLSVSGISPCDSLISMGQVGDTYGSLNSLMTISLAIIAIMTFAAQNKQIHDISKNNVKENIMNMISVYLTIDGDNTLERRCALIKSIIYQSSKVSLNERIFLLEIFKPTPSELLKIKTVNMISIYPWLKEQWT